MVRYKIVKKKVVVDGLTLDDASETLMAMQDSEPEQTFSIEKYNWVALENTGLGRDPDLH
jgi:hypothetical protein